MFQKAFYDFVEFRMIVLFLFNIFMHYLFYENVLTEISWLYQHYFIWHFVLISRFSFPAKDHLQCNMRKMRNDSIIMLKPVT